MSTIKRHLFTEAAQRGLDATAQVLQGHRLIFQVFDPAGRIPKLPEGSDARKKHPWAKWLDGEEHEVTLDGENDRQSLRAYIYKQAKARGLKVRVSLTDEGLNIKAYKEEE